MEIPTISKIFSSWPWLPFRRRAAPAVPIYASEPTVDDVIDALGGTAVVARHCQVSMPAVSNWRHEGFIPARHHLTIDRWARGVGLHIPDSFYCRKTYSGRSARKRNGTNQ